MEQRDIIERIAAILQRYGDAATANLASREVAQQWIDAGFDDPEEIEAWLDARCFTADGAQALERAGITPEQAALRTRAGASGDEDTIAHKLTHDDLTFDEARRIITSHFWNT